MTTPVHVPKLGDRYEWTNGPFRVTNVDRGFVTLISDDGRRLDVTLEGFALTPYAEPVAVVVVVVVDDAMTDERLDEIDADLSPGGHSHTYEIDLPLFGVACELFNEVKRLRAKP